MKRKKHVVRIIQIINQSTFLGRVSAKYKRFRLKKLGMGIKHVKRKTILTRASIT